jgi:hypothetical protein
MVELLGHREKLKLPEIALAFVVCAYVPLEHRALCVPLVVPRLQG